MLTTNRRRVILRANCASCHGADLTGAADWKPPRTTALSAAAPRLLRPHLARPRPRPDRNHPRRLRLPQSRMPAFGDRLTDEDIEAILEFIKTSWGPQEKAYQDLVTEQDQARP